MEKFFLKNVHFFYFTPMQAEATFAQCELVCKKLHTSSHVKM